MIQYIIKQYYQQVFYYYNIDSKKKEFREYTEITIPPMYDQSSSQNIRLVSIDELEDYAQLPFDSILKYII